MEPKKPTGKILILGGGFGGIRTALDLEKKLKGLAQITLIDRNGYHLFLPSLYEVASAYAGRKDPFAVTLRKTVAIPYADIFEGKKINFVRAEISKLDLRAQLVTTKGDSVFSYDYLVLALGSQVSDFGIPGVKEYACQFKTIDDAVLINRTVETLFAQAIRGTRQFPIKIYICGGGFTGIELAAELSVYAKNMARKHRLKNRPVQLYIFEAMPKILPNISDKTREVIRKRLTKLGVVVMENSPIEAVQQDGVVKLKSGQMMQGDIVVWTAGIEANHFLRTVVGLDLSERGKVIVGEHLHLSRYRNVFAVGDNIEFIDHRTQKPIPSLAYLAVDHGKVAAKNISNSIREKELMVHKPFYDLWIAPVGGKFAVAHLWWGMIASGFFGWVARNFADLRYYLSILPPKKAFSLFFNNLKVFLKND